MSSSFESTKLVVALRVGRAALGWSQVEAAEKLGIAKTTLARIETNEVKPSAEIVISIVRTYSENGVNLDFMFGDEIKVAITVDAIKSVQAKLDDPAQRRSDRLPLGNQVLAALEDGKPKTMNTLLAELKASKANKGQ